MEIPSAPMATSEQNTPVVPAGTVAEPKVDGYRALVARWDDGSVLIRSRQGTDMTAKFPEIAEAAARLPDSAGSILLDGELVVWESGRLAFQRLGKRLNASPATVRRIRAEFPAHFIAFDLLHIGGRGSLIREPYRVRRAALEKLFKQYKLTTPWQLCPATTDIDTIREWLTDGVEKLGYEGVVWKAPEDPYRPGARGWHRYKVRATTEAVIGAVTGRITQPQSLFLGRLDRDGRLRYVGRSTPLRSAAATKLGTLLSPAAPGHPWTGRRFSAAWGSSATISPILVEPRIVAEISVDAAKDHGVYRHQVKYVRVRAELQPKQTPTFDDGD
jgi:ATP-dependent DNA ligase